MNRLADALREYKELHQKITALGNVEKRKPFSLQSDLDYIEDSGAEVDCNVVMANDGQFIEFQSTGEEAKFSKKTILDFIDLVEHSMPNIFQIQNAAIEK